MGQRILVVDDDIDTLRLVGIVLERQGYVIGAADSGERAIQKALDAPPDLIILDVMMPDISGFEVAKKLRSHETTKTIPIIMFTAKTQVDDKVRGFDAGADAYLTKPTQPRELLAQVKALLARTEATREVVNTVPRGFLIGILAPKGGLGVSSAAINLGLSMHQITQEKVTVADLNPGSGDIGISLGYTDHIGITNLLKADAASITASDVKDELVKHVSGIHLLLSPQRPQDAIFASKIEQYQTIVQQLPFLAKYTILDLGSALPPLTQAVLDQCDEILLLVEPSHAGITHTKMMLDSLNFAGISQARVHLILLNRQRTNTQLSWTDVQEALDMEIATVITPAPDLAYRSREDHRPMIMLQPESLTAEQYSKLAALLIKE